ncbi:uncharacterized protein METZ01_LOCUS95671 [marine metagenome]|uniref:Translation elongation factor EFTs/EF1B dimerisation domain-containing protein n=1 Tax=marine metagenome TaxID=408172 RepID=A0A381VT69_9ZZZZ
MMVPAAAVKELRQRTGAGMMDCKKALVEAKGNLEQASEFLRKAGQAKADKRASRVAAEGRIVVSSDFTVGRHVIVEVNSETDFVAKDDNFGKFSEHIGQCILTDIPGDIGALMEINVNDNTLEVTRQALVTKMGENISVRRFDILESSKIVGSYVHMARIGVLIEINGGDETLARDLAMHAAATSPHYVSTADIAEGAVNKEREILTAQAEKENKPAHIVEKIVEGRLRKYLNEITLVGQPFVKDPDKTVGTLLSEAGASVIRFLRYEVGEGIQKKQDDFAQEVRAQASGSL